MKLTVQKNTDCVSWRIQKNLEHSFAKFRRKYEKSDLLHLLFEHVYGYWLWAAKEGDYLM